MRILVPMAGVLLPLGLLGAAWLVPGALLKSACIVAAIMVLAAAVLTRWYLSTSDRCVLPVHHYHDHLA